MLNGKQKEKNNVECQKNCDVLTRAPNQKKKHTDNREQLGMEKDNVQHGKRSPILKSLKIVVGPTYIFT